MVRGTKPAADVEAAEVGAIENVTEEFNPDPFFARGDCRDAMLEVIRSAVDWNKFDEQRQRDINTAIDNASREIVAKLARGLAANGKETVSASIDSLNIKDGGIKIVAKANFDAGALATLANAKMIEIAIADPSANMAERAPARVDPDQPDLMATGAECDQDLVDAADPPPSDILRTGDCVEIKGEECEIEIDLKSEMVMATPRSGNAISDRFDVRAATTAELAAERERVADFHEEEPSKAA